MKLTESNPLHHKGIFFVSNRTKFVFNFQLSTFNCLQSEKAHPQKHIVFCKHPELGSKYRRILIAKLTQCQNDPPVDILLF